MSSGYTKFIFRYIYDINIARTNKAEVFLMKWNQQSIKRNNKQKLLHTIIEKSPISRADLSSQLGLTKGTVSSLVAELIDEQLCYESGPGISSGGRRPVILHFNNTAGYAIGIDLGVNYILGILTNMQGEIILEKKQKIKSNDFDQTASTIIEIIHSLLQMAPASHYGVIGIGIGVPGIVSIDYDILLAPNLGWKNKNLKKMIEEHFQIPVIIANEANAGAYGEKQYGAGKLYQNLIYISAGIGIGGGIILNNEVYEGIGGFSGEIGHMMIDCNGKLCRCGSKGCWELYASEQALLNKARRIPGIGDHLTLTDLINQAPHNQEIQTLFHEIGQYLGIGISNLINIFNPQQIIIGNQLGTAKDWLNNGIMQMIEIHTLNHLQPNVTISYAEQPAHSNALGVSAIIIENFLTSVHASSFADAE